MCILFVYGDSKPKPYGYKLILASNRDEYYSRPAALVSPWKVKSSNHIFGGIDLEPGKEGGTWLAVGGNKNNIKVGVLLNITGSGESRKSDVIGRGHIISDYITNNKSNYEHSQELIDNCLKYNAFNLVSVDIHDDKVDILNCSNAPVNSIRWAEREPHGFGNSPPSNPFKKVEEGTLSFKEIIENCNRKEDLVEKSMNLLKSTTKYLPDKELEKRAPTWSEYMSSIAVTVPNIGYGSRTRSVILIDSENKMDFYEETMSTSDPSDKWLSSHIEYQF